MAIDSPMFCKNRSHDHDEKKKICRGFIKTPPNTGTSSGTTAAKTRSVAFTVNEDDEVVPLSQDEVATIYPDLPASSDTTTSEPAKSEPGASAPASSGPAASASAPSTAEPKTSTHPGADLSTLSIEPLSSPPPGRQTSTLVSLTPYNPPAVAVGFHSFDLTPAHPRLIAFPTNSTPSAFTLNFNAQADTAPSPDSDTGLLSGTAAWLRALPNDPAIQIGRVSVGKAYGGGWGEKGLPPTNTVNVTFPRAFEGAEDAGVKVVLWLCGMDFSKAYNWRVRVSASSVTTQGFTCTVATWEDSILYKADVCWIAHLDGGASASASTSGRVESGVFSTNDVRPPKPWVNQTEGTLKFEEGRQWQKSPRVVCGLNLLEVGCGRPFRIRTSVEASKDNLKWGLNSDGDAHLYQAGVGWVAIDADSETIQTSVTKALGSIQALEKV